MQASYSLRHENGASLVGFTITVFPVIRAPAAMPVARLSGKLNGEITAQVQYGRITLAFVTAGESETIGTTKPLFFVYTAAWYRIMSTASPTSAIASTRVFPDSYVMMAASRNRFFSMIAAVFRRIFARSFHDFARQAGNAFFAVTIADLMMAGYAVWNFPTKIPVSNDDRISNSGRAKISLLPMCRGGTSRAREQAR